MGRNRDRVQPPLILDGVHLTERDFSDRRISAFTACASLFERCSFERTVFSQVCFGGGRRRTTYRDCSFAGADIRARSPGIARFERCSFEDATIREFYGKDAEFIDCTFSGMIMKAIFDARVDDEFRDMLGQSLNEYRGNDFSRAQLKDVTFRGGVDLSLQVLPSGEEYVYIPDLARTLALVESIVANWSDGDLRGKAWPVLQALRFDLESGQEQALLTPAPYPADMQTAILRLREEIRAASSRLMH